MCRSWSWSGCSLLVRRSTLTSSGPNLVSAHLMPASVRTERLGGVARDGQQSAIRQRQGELDFQAVPTAQRLDSIGVGLQRQVVREQRVYLDCAVCDQL